MLLNGKKIEGPNTETVVIPRGNGEHIVFTLQAILSYDEFNALCPQPKPPKKKMRGGRTILDLEDKFYVLQCNEFATRRFAWMVLESLKATPGLTWETVKYNNPDTWMNYTKELKDSGFSDSEQQLIVTKMMDVNCLNEAKLEEARDRFLASQEEAKVSSSQMEEQSNMESGEPANV